MADRWPWPGLVIALWGIGVLVRWSVLIGRAWPGRRVGRTADRHFDAALFHVLDRECARAGLVRQPGLRLVPDNQPKLTGLWRPTIELPEMAVEWPEQKLEAVLGHELAHLRRGDLWWMIVTETALALVWGHPGATHLRGRLARLREEACDDAVLTNGMDPASYAAHLASFLSGSVPASRGWALPAVERTGWMGRFRRLLDPRVSRRMTKMWEVVGLSLAAGIVASAGTFFIGCAGFRENQAAPTDVLATQPATPPKLRSGARKLNIELKVFEMTVRTREATKLGFPEGFSKLIGKVLTMDEGWKLFHQGRGEIRFITSPKLTARPGQELKIESGKPIRYPTEFLPNRRTGILEPVAYEERMVGELLTIAAWPSEAPDKLHLRYRFELREHEGNIQYSSPPGVVQPVFNTRMTSDEIEMMNGSYIIVGFKPSTQKLANFVPEPTNKAQYDRWRREAGGEAYGRLAAVQVLVEETKD